MAYQRDELVDSQSTYAKFIINSISGGEVDVGGIIDSVLLLSYLKVSTSYDFLVSLLTHDRHIIRSRVVNIFSAIKYGKSYSELIKYLALYEDSLLGKYGDFEKVDNYLISKTDGSDYTIYRALALNGEEESYSTLLTHYYSNGSAKGNVVGIAYSLFWSNPKRAITDSSDWLKDIDNDKASKLGFYILDTARNWIPPYKPKFIYSYSYSFGDGVSISTEELAEAVLSRLDNYPSDPGVFVNVSCDRRSPSTLGYSRFQTLMYTMFKLNKSNNRFEKYPMIVEATQGIVM